MSSDALDLLQLDAVCTRFVQRWADPNPPRIEDFLEEVSLTHRPDLLRELLLAEWSQLLQRGQTVSPESYRLRFAALPAIVDDSWGQWLRWLAAPNETPSEFSPPTRYNADPPVAISPLTSDYPLLAEIGRGGMGVVYKAHDPRLNRPVALKMMRDGLFGSDGRGRFRIEAEALARLAHPHIVQVFTWHEQDNRPCLVMEYVAGGSLEDRLGKAAMPPDEAARLVAVLARAAHAAHEAGIVHRDLKPANVLMAAPVEGNSGTVFGGFPKISDFGLARLAGLAGHTLQGQPIGTPAYMAPEQAEGAAEIGPAADVWALGVILYRCLMGTMPFRGSVLEILERVKTQPPPPLSDSLPHQLRSICLSCLAKSPQDRPTAGALAERLESCAKRGDDARITTEWERPPSTAEAPTGTPTKGPQRPPILLRRPRGCAITVTIAFACLLLSAIPIGLLNWPSGVTRPPGLTPEIPPARILSLRIDHMVIRGGESFDKGVIGENVFEATVDDGTQVEVKLAEPAYAFLIAFNFDGSEQLLWPRDEKGKPDANRVPEAVKSLRVPGKIGHWMYLDDDQIGGLQAYAVVASNQPFPSFAEWKKTRGEAAWKKLPPRPARGESKKQVWVADLENVYRWIQGSPLDRFGKSGPLPDAPPLAALVESLRRGAEVEAVEVVAFEVRPKGDE